MLGRQVAWNALPYFCWGLVWFSPFWLLVAVCGCVLKGAGGHSGAMGQEAGLSKGSGLAVDGASNVGQGMSYSLGAKFFTLVGV